MAKPWKLAKCGLLFLVAISVSGIPLSSADPLTLAAPEPLMGSYDEEANALHLNWTTPNGYGTHAGDKFRIYVNQEWVADTTTDSYDADLSTWNEGIRAYTVTMVWDGQESLHTQPYTLLRTTTPGPIPPSCQLWTFSFFLYPPFFAFGLNEACLPDP